MNIRKAISLVVDEGTSAVEVLPAVTADVTSNVDEGLVAGALGGYVGLQVGQKIQKMLTGHVGIKCSAKECKNNKRGTCQLDPLSVVIGKDHNCESYR